MLYLYLCPVEPRKTREAAKNGAEPLENGNGKKNTQDQLKQTKVEEESVDQKRDPAEGKEIPAAEANKLEEKQFDVRGVSSCFCDLLMRSMSNLFLLLAGEDQESDFSFGQN